MSLLYLAEDTLMRRDVVLKVLGKLIIGRLSLERFQREIQAVALLNHDNIVRAYHAARIGKTIVLVMEYVDGLDLHRLVESQGPLSVESACDYVRQASLGLQHAHENNLVHRDIKPSNLILTRQGGRDIVKVLDFGLAKVRSEAPPDWAITYKEQLLGTPDYIAPEQITDARKADIRSDIYSLGATLYYLLSGRPPFQGTNLYDILRSHKNAAAKPLNLVRPEVPKALADLVAKMMAKKPSRRFQTPAEVASALTAFLEPNTNPTKSQLSFPPAQPLRWAAAGLLLISLVFAVILIFKTKDGTIVFENLPEQSVVTADGERFNVEWPEGKGKGRAKITIPAGKHAVEVKVKGVRVSGEEVSVRSGGATRFVVRYDPGRAEQEESREAVPAPAPIQFKKTANTELVLIPPGEFTMGSEIGPPGEDDRPRHSVRISRSFYLGVYEVTQELYKNVTGKNPSHFPDRPKNPVESVTWFDAVTFCNKLSQLEKIPPYYRINPNNSVTILGGKGYRLPTEAEWEYACRAGNPKDLPFWTNRDLGEVAWIGSNSGGKTHLVGKKPPNAFGLHDIYGNVWEWCWDWVGLFSKNRSVDPKGPDVGKYRVLKGNSWVNGDYFWV